jgi:hypothetical protein
MYLSDRAATMTTTITTKTQHIISAASKFALLVAWTIIAT